MRRALLSATLALTLAPPALGAALRGGKTIDVAHSARDVRHPDEQHELRIFVPKEARGQRRIPLVVFLHGVNKKTVRFHSMGGSAGEHPLDVREVVAELVGRGDVAPFVLAGPTTRESAKLPRTLFAHYDLDRTVEEVVRALGAETTIDLDRVVVAGHSGGACNPGGGLASALAGTSLRVLAGMSIDACMTEDDARSLAEAPSETELVVTWQPYTWQRDYATYGTILSEVRKGAEGKVVLSELTPPPQKGVHGRMVRYSFEAHLPRLLGTGASAAR